MLAMQISLFISFFRKYIFYQFNIENMYCNIEVKEHISYNTKEHFYNQYINCIKSFQFIQTYIFSNISVDNLHQIMSKVLSTPNVNHSSILLTQQQQLFKKLLFKKDLYLILPADIDNIEPFQQNNDENSKEQYKLIAILSKILDISSQVLHEKLWKMLQYCIANYTLPRRLSYIYDDVGILEDFKKYAYLYNFYKIILEIFAITYQKHVRIYTIDKEKQNGYHNPSIFKNQTVLQNIKNNQNIKEIFSKEKQPIENNVLELDDEDYFLSCMMINNNSNNTLPSRQYIIIGRIANMFYKIEEKEGEHEKNIEKFLNYEENKTFQIIYDHQNEKVQKNRKQTNNFQERKDFVMPSFKLMEQDDPNAKNLAESQLIIMPALQKEVGDSEDFIKNMQVFKPTMQLSTEITAMDLQGKDEKINQKHDDSDDDNLSSPPLRKYKSQYPTTNQHSNNEFLLEPISIEKGQDFKELEKLIEACGPASSSEPFNMPINTNNAVFQQQTNLQSEAMPNNSSNNNLSESMSAEQQQMYYYYMNNMNSLNLFSQQQGYYPNQNPNHMHHPGYHHMNTQHHLNQHHLTLSPTKHKNQPHPNQPHPNQPHNQPYYQNNTNNLYSSQQFQSHKTNSVHNDQVLNQNERYTGGLKFFDEGKSYGFIIMDADDSDIFVHFDDLQKAGISKEIIKTFKQNQMYMQIRFSFKVMEYFGKYKKSRKAVELIIIDEDLHPTSYAEVTQ